MAAAEEVLSCAPDAPLTADDLAGLPTPVSRYLRRTLGLGEPLTPALRLTMRGHIKVGRWLPFTATELLHPHRGFRWDARAAHGLVVGHDQYLGGQGEMAWRLLGLIPIVRADGPDVSRSGAARAAAESVWAPAALLPRYGTRWAGGDDASATARLQLDDVTIEVDFTFDTEGRVTSIAFDRWGDADRTGRFGWHRFGGTMTAHRTFGTMTIPSAGALGWHYGTDRWNQGEFFRYELTQAAPLLPMPAP